MDEDRVRAIIREEIRQWQKETLDPVMPTLIDAVEVLKERELVRLRQRDEVGSHREKLDRIMDRYAAAGAG